MTATSLRQSVLDGARRVATPRVKRAARRLGGRPLVAFERRGLTPELSVVMPVYNVADYLPEALDSVLTQTLHNVEVIAVDDGSTDSCLAILRDYERRDPRVKVLTQPNSGQGEARNLGVSVARGEFLTFVDSDDTLPADAFVHLIASLRASGSDFSVGSVRRLHHGSFQRTAWMRTVHEADHLGVTLEEFPRAMQDILAHHRVFRTSFWRDRVGGFRAHIAYEDHVPMLMAYVRAAKFDSLKQVTYNWRIREDLTSTGQQKASLENLLDRIAVMEEAHELLRAESSDFVYDTWVGRVLELDFPPFITHALQGDASYRHLLAATFRTYFERATERALDMVTVRQKLRGRLAADERWAELHVADAHFEEIRFVPRAQGRDGFVVASPPDDERLGFYRDVDPRLLRLAPIESHFQGVAEHVEWEPGRVRISGWAVRRGLPIEDPDAAALRAWLISSTGEQLPLSVHATLVPQANVWGNLPLAAYHGGGFSLEVDLDALRPTSGSAHSWHVEVETTYAGVTSRGPLLEHVRESAAARPSGSQHAWGSVTGSVRTRWDDGRGLCLDVDTTGADAPVASGPRVQVSSLRLGEDALEVEVSGHGPDPQSLGDIGLSGQRASLPLAPGAGEVAQLRFGLRPEPTDGGHPAPSGRYELTQSTPHGSTRLTASISYAGRLPDRQHGPLVNLRVGQDGDGRLAVHLEPPLPPEAQGASQLHRLRETYRQGTAAVVDAVLFRRGAGEGADGELSTLDRALAGGRPGTPRYWTVADYSVRVPEGSVPLVLDSPEWYDALLTSAFLCSDTDFGPFLRRRPGQHHLRTFSGAAPGDVGRDAWRRRGLSADQVLREIERRHREWDTLLVRTEQEADLVRAQLDLRDHQILVAGDPKSLRSLALGEFFSRD